jgi:hypothetical protein
MHLGAASLFVLLLLSAAQPLFSEDVWWHLSMGRAFSAEGPWLSADPLLHTAELAPAPASWLAGVLLYQVERAFGFHGLRVLHVLLVAGIGLLAWLLLRRASGSPRFASLGLSVFVALSAYRLFQLRPHLFTILATLLLLLLLQGPARGPRAAGGPDDAPLSWRRIFAGAALLAVWSNLHAGFVLGPVLIASALGGAVAALLAGDRRILGLRLGSADAGRRRQVALRLTMLLVLGVVASLANPAGGAQYLPYFSAGGETPGLGVVSDEWGRLELFALPALHHPPSLLAWICVWGVLLATPACVWLAARRSRAVDAVWISLAGVGAIAMLTALRFLWIGIAPLAACGQALSRAGGPGRQPARTAWAVAVASLLLVPAFVWLGDWPMISQGVRSAVWAEPYEPTKVDAHAVWFLDDAGVEGRAYNDYSNGNFLGYWLAPRVTVFVNGSLNVPEHVMEARHAIQTSQLPDDSSLTSLLDRYRVDVFFGTGLPVVPLPGRPLLSTTRHLEDEPGWLLVFRNLRSGIYLRDQPRNRENLERIAAWYEEQQVPFDRERGFDVLSVLRDAPAWAAAHGMVPVDFSRLERNAGSLDPSIRGPAQLRLAGVHALLGLYDRAADLAGRRLRQDPGSLLAARQLVWSLLHARRIPESREAARQLEEIARPEDGLSRALIEAADRCGASSREACSARVARLPLLGRAEVPWLMSDVHLGETRPSRAGRSGPAKAERG